MIYKALLSQTSTNAPEAIIGRSELGGNVTYEYLSTGEYAVRSNGLFKEDRTHFDLTLNYRALSGDIASYQVLWISESELRILTFDNLGMMDEALTKTPFWIEVF